MDYFDLSTYGLHGYWETTTGHPSALYSPSGGQDAIVSGVCVSFITVHTAHYCSFTKFFFTVSNSFLLQFQIPLDYTFFMLVHVVRISSIRSLSSGYEQYF